MDIYNQPWFKRADIGRILGLENIATLIKGLDESESRTRNKTDVFLSVYGVMHVIVEKKQEDHQLVIKEKDAAISLLNHDLSEAKNYNQDLELLVTLADALINTTV